MSNQVVQSLLTDIRAKLDAAFVILSTSTSTTPPAAVVEETKKTRNLSKEVRKQMSLRAKARWAPDGKLRLALVAKQQADAAAAAAKAAAKVSG